MTFRLGAPALDASYGLCQWRLAWMSTGYGLGKMKQRLDRRVVRGRLASGDGAVIRVQGF